MMSEDKKNILVIENQQCEFECIADFLKKDYNVYPATDDFLKFINNVHVALNKQYHKAYRGLALGYIKSIVIGKGKPFGNERPVDLILMDHILGGAHYCHTGIDLANYLNSDRKNNPIPVVFLSRTSQDDKKKLEGSLFDEGSFDLAGNSLHRMGYEKHYSVQYPNSSRWVHKGYFGEETLDNTDIDNDTLTYFDKYVIPAIEAIMPLSEKANLLNAIEHILEKYAFTRNESDRKSKIEYIKNSVSNGRTYNNDFKNFIFTIRDQYNVSSKYRQMDNNDIEIINKQHKSLTDEER